MRRHGMVLPVVLVIIALLALTMAGFVFFVRAEIASVSAFSDGQQTRLAAQSGFDELMLLLRERRDDPTLWYDNPAQLRNALVWSETYDRQSDPLLDVGSRRVVFEGVPVQARPVAWRYSIVAPRWEAPEDTIRFGLTPESAKLNINTYFQAGREDVLRRLMEPLITELGLENAPDLIAAIFDWMDEDDEPREGGAEGPDYYNTLEPPYNAKNGALDSIEELLLVKGITPAILYGEDTNRNGILDYNEDDGDESFPFYDNGDGLLNPGLAPFLTVFSREIETASDNRPRINLNAQSGQIAAQIATYFQDGELSGATIGFLSSLQAQQINPAELQSPAWLYSGGFEEAEFAGEEGAEAAPPYPQVNSPITLEELPYVMDYFSTRPVEQANQPVSGLININAAPARVLRLVPGMTPEAVEALIAARTTFESETLRTLAWPVTTETLDVATWKRIAPYTTTKAYQFHVEILGYADHNMRFSRLEWIIEMIGPMPQIKYHRDLSSLGFAWPIDDETTVVIPDS